MPLLRDAIASAPAPWKDKLAKLCSLLGTCGTTVRTYGSLGWQYLTGEQYLRDQSDIDLLIEPTREFDVGAALHVFRDLALQNMPRIDGELIVGPDEAVAWREFDTSPPEILVRSVDSIQLVPKTEIIARLTQAVSA